jgi:hypothetical protein
VQRGRALLAREASGGGCMRTGGPVAPLVDHFLLLGSSIGRSLHFVRQHAGALSVQAANLLLDRNGVIKLADFGMAKQLLEQVRDVMRRAAMLNDVICLSGAASSLVA